MKKFFLYIAAALSLAACSSEEKLIEEEDKYEIDASAYGDMSYSIMPLLRTTDTRSELYYNYTTGGVTFAWIPTTDIIDVYPVTAGANNNYQKFKIDELADGNPNIGVFGKLNENDEFQTFLLDQYVSFYPSQQSDQFTYENIPVNYEDQKQASAPYIYYYRYRAQNIDDPEDTNSPKAKLTEQQCLERYVASERAACTHLPEKDYLVSGPTTPTANHHLHFNMARMSAEIRFFIALPDVEATYDRLQVFNPNGNKPFVVQTTMNAETKVLDVVSPTKKTANSIVLQLGDNGFQFFPTKDKEHYNIRYKYSDTTPLVLAAYMMAAPINLNESEDKNCLLYLHSHYGTAEHKVYKATLSKINILQNYLNQWSARGFTLDDPIQFESISIQDWAEETGYNNGDGNGTHTW